MTKFLTFMGILFCFSSGLFAQTSSITICRTTPTQSFAALGSDQEFVTEHNNPMPFRYKDQEGEMISINTPDGKTTKAYYLKASVDIDSYILVFHEWWGLNDYIKKESDKYYNAFNKKVNVIALDLYDGKVATTREEAAKLMQQVNEARAQAIIINGAIEFAGNSSEIATLGWCFGGGWSLQAAMLANDHAKGAIMYYGMPETDKDKIKSIEFPVLGIFAKQDDHITPAVVNTFKQEMNKAGKTFYLNNYEAVHAFANPSNPKYDKKAAEDAYKKSITFLKRVLD